MTYGDFLRWHELCTQEVQKDDERILAAQQRPRTLCGERVPGDLGALTYGQLTDMQALTETDNIPMRLCEIIFGKSLDIYSEDVNKVFGFLNFCRDELQRINKLFSGIETSYSPEEIAAGARQLDFGAFGVLDWYAKRMGIKNQNDVRDVAWVRIYTCMKNDNEVQKYERRLQDAYMKKGKGR